MAGKNQQYVEQYAEYAMAQMRLYGIPASVTLAQGILESASGQSQLARNENNHFGIKASKSWLDAGGRYGLYTDDKPNEKFCSYDSVLDSYNHHSQFLAGNKRYAACFALSADDYKGWAWGLDKAGYATAGQYAPALINIIERNGLAKYDQMVMAEMAAQGLTPGQARPQTATVKAPPPLAQPTVEYSFPLKRDEFMFVSSAYGNRTDPMDHNRMQFHKGIDIKCNNEALLATEMNGKVIAVNNNANTAGGKSVTVEYDRADGTKMQVFYCHLSQVSVNIGDKVNAGQQIGVSGNTGTRTTGPHLHFGVKQVSEDGTKRDIDPAAYLADIAQKGNIQLTAMYNGKDLLDKYKTNDVAVGQENNQDDDLAIDTSLSPDEWMKKLLSSEDSGVSLKDSHDPIMDLAITLFSSLMLLATQIDNKSELEQMTAATNAAISRQVDLSPLLPGLQSCTLDMNEGKPVLSVNTGANVFTHELTNSEMNRLNLALSDHTLSASEKQQRVTNVIGSIVAVQQSSLNYEQNASLNNDNPQSMQR